MDEIGLGGILFVKNYLYISQSGDGQYNLGLDEWFLDNVRDDELILYFYVNEKAVIIGKNQNPRKECNIPQMRNDGVQLVRRISGGGAVYHDGGNLNFSFIAGSSRFNKDDQHNFILNVVRSLGIECEFSGRNDLISNGRKFSGNAYCSKGKAKQHHGTLLVDTDLSRLQNYLTVDERKIRSKGVDSVVSRVCNLSQINSSISVEELLNVIPKEFERTFGAYRQIATSELPVDKIKPYIKKHSSEEWLFGSTPAFDYIFDERFTFGGVQIYMQLKSNVITSLTVHTDSMDTTLPDKIKDLLLFKELKKDTVCSALCSCNDDALTAIADKFSEVL